MFSAKLKAELAGETSVGGRKYPATTNHFQKFWEEEREGWKKKRKDRGKKSFLFGLCSGVVWRNCDGVVEEFWRRYGGVVG